MCQVLDNADEWCNTLTARHALCDEHTMALLLQNETAYTKQFDLIPPIKNDFFCTEMFFDDSSDSNITSSYEDMFNDPLYLKIYPIGFQK